MRALTVCVEYDDLLRLTLPRLLRHFDWLLVVTSPADDRTQYLVAQTVAEAMAGDEARKVQLHVTDAFTRGGATFNKGLAIEEGLDVLGRDGWLAIVDADIVLPSTPIPNPQSLIPGFLYGPARRRMCVDPAAWDRGDDWSAHPFIQDHELAGFFQLFHASDPALWERPWYGIDWRHAGGCDSVFQAKWPAERRVRLPFEVLHLGPDGTNWHGRISPRLDGAAIPGREARARAHAEMHRLRGQFGTSRERLEA